MDLTTLAMAKRYTNQQRLGYIEEETTPIFTDILVEGKGFTSVTGVQPNLIEGETYIVTINGVSEKYVCKYMPGDGYQQTYIGNFALYEHSKEDTGEDFLIAKVRETVVKIYNDRNEDISVSCVLYSETIHPIDPKYLPGVCLPVVELSGVILEQNQLLTDDENAQLDELYAKKVPIICNVTVANIQTSVPLLWISNNSYATVTPIGEFSLGKTDSGWVANLV